MLVETLSAREKHLLKAIRYIMESIIFPNQVIQLQTLAKEISCSLNTLKNDLDALNTLQPTINYNCFSLSFSQSDISQSLEYIYLKIIYQSQTAQLIEMIHKESVSSIKEVSKDLSISDSAASRLIKSINQVLSKNLNIRIDTTTFRFEGKETDIRKFLFKYYKEKQNYQPFAHCGGVEQLQQYYLINPTDFNPNLIDYFGTDILLALFINHHRISQGYRLKDIDNSAINEIYQEQLKYLVSSTFPDFDCSLLFCDITYPFCYVGVSDLQIENILTQGILEIQEMFQIQGPSIPKILLPLQLMIKVGYLHDSYQTIFYSDHNHLIHYFKHRFPAFFESCSKIMIDVLNQLGAKDYSAKDFLITYLINLWPGLSSNLIAVYPKIKIVLIGNYSYELSQWTQHLIKYDMADIIRLDIYNQYNLDLNQLLNYDIILSQIKLNRIDHPHILYIGPIMLTENYHHLENLVTHLYNQQTLSKPPVKKGD